MRPPFAQGTPEQGLQSSITPARRYRISLAAVEDFCRKANAGKSVAQLGPEQMDKLLGGLERGEVKLDGADARGFFELLLQNTMEGFFADPVYGGNKDMVGWKLVGFPGARYDFRDHVGKHNQTYPLPPVGHRRPAGMDVEGMSAWHASCRPRTWSSSAWAGPARSSRNR